MADNLQWLNKHFVLLKYNTMGELITQGGYELSPKYKHLYTSEISVQDFIGLLVKEECFREAINILAYAIHRRAGVWWGLCSLELLYKELQEAKEEARQKELAEQQAAQKAAEQEKKEGSKQKTPEEIEEEKEDEEIQKTLADAEKKIAEAKSKFTPEQKKIYDDTWKRFDEEFTKAVGMGVMQYADYIKNLPDDEPKPEPPAAPEQPKAPEKPEDHSGDPMPESMLANYKRTAFEIVYRWVQEPSAENSIEANDIARVISDETEGMLAQTAYWSYGNLSVEMEDGSNVPAPTGLAGNGLRTTLLSAMLTDGGKYSLRERAEQYLNLGCKIACGQNNWTSTPPPKYGFEANATKKTSTNGNNTEEYRKWK